MPELNPGAQEQPAAAVPERASEQLERMPGREQVATPPLPAVPSAAEAPVRPIVPPVGAAPALQHQVEQVLEEGLEQIYLELSAADQAKFKALGEATAARITGLLERAKVKLGELLALIRRWLATVPGLSQYFVEQEAKNKAAKLMRLRLGK